MKQLRILYLFVLILAVAAGFQSVMANHVQPIPVFNNTVCSKINPNWLELVISDVSNGTTTDGTLTVTISNAVINSGPNQSVTFDWSSNLPVVGVIVRGGQNGDNFYEYNPPAMSDTLLTPDAQGSDVSEALFCYVLPTPPSPVIPVYNNTVCRDINPGWLEFNLSDVKEGTYTDGTLIITISNVVIDPVSNQTVSFDWSSNLPIVGIIVRGGETADNFYQYDPPATSGTGLTPDGLLSGVSEGLFCYVTTTPTEPPTDTPTPPPPPQQPGEDTDDGAFENVDDGATDTSDPDPENDGAFDNIDDGVTDTSDPDPVNVGADEGAVGDEDNVPNDN